MKHRDKNIFGNKPRKNTPMKNAHSMKMINEIIKEKGEQEDESDGEIKQKGSLLVKDTPRFVEKELRRGKNSILM